MKNIVFMMDIDLEGKGDHDNRYHSKRRLPYQYLYVFKDIIFLILWKLII